MMTNLTTSSEGKRNKKTKASERAAYSNRNRTVPRRMLE